MCHWIIFPITLFCGAFFLTKREPYLQKDLQNQFFLCATNVYGPISTGEFKVLVPFIQKSETTLFRRTLCQGWTEIYLVTNMVENVYPFLNGLIFWAWKFCGIIIIVLVFGIIKTLVWVVNHAFISHSNHLCNIPVKWNTFIANSLSQS